MAFFKKPGGFGGPKKNDRYGDRFGKKDFGRPGFGGDKPRFGGKPSFGSRPPVQLFKATCAKCGKLCEVPFRPTGEKPVYCNDCFSATKDRDGGSRGFEKRDFKPRESRDSYAPRESFKAPAEDKRIDEIKKQLDAMQSKINDILQMVTVYRIDQATKAVVEKKKAAPKKKTTPKKK